MATTIPNVSKFADPAPQRGDRTTFRDRADSMVSHFTTIIGVTGVSDGEMNDSIDAMNTVAGECEAAQTAAELAETNAETAQTAAEAAQAAATATANATIYAAGTTYSAGDVVLDPGDSYQSYTSQQGANTGNTPNTDDGTWWVLTVSALRPDANSALLTGNTLTVDSGATLDVNGSIDLAGATLTLAAGQILSDVILQDHAEQHASVSSSSGVLTLDYTSGPNYATTLTENVSTLTLSNWPASGNLGMMALQVTQDSSSAYTIAWGSVDFGDGGAPDLSDLSGVTQAIMWTRDGGTTIYGNGSWQKTT